MSSVAMGAASLGMEQVARYERGGALALLLTRRLLGWRPSLLGWTTRVEAIAGRYSRCAICFRKRGRDPCNRRVHTKAQFGGGSLFTEN